MKKGCREGLLDSLDAMHLSVKFVRGWLERVPCSWALLRWLERKNTTQNLMQVGGS